MRLRNGKHIKTSTNIVKLKYWFHRFDRNIKKTNRYQKDLHDIIRLKKLYPHIFNSSIKDKKKNTEKTPKDKKKNTKNTPKDKKKITKKKTNKNKVKSENSDEEKSPSEDSDEEKSPNEYNYEDGWLVPEDDKQEVVNYSEKDILLEIKKQYKQVKHQGSKYMKGIRQSQRNFKKPVTYIDSNYLKLMLEDSKISDIFSDTEIDDIPSESDDSDFVIDSIYDSEIE